MLLSFLFLALAAIVIPIAVAIPAEKKHQRAVIHDAQKVDGYTPQMMNVSTGNPGKCPSGTKYFLQITDHGISSIQDSNSTFLQQYQIIDEYYKPGGPILFFQGMETDEITCLEELSLPEWAKELGALAVGLEHRYFGISCPYGLNYSEAATWPVPLYKQLTMDNVFSDAIALLDWVKQQYNATSSKVIIISASYGGTLSAIGRVKYPETFFGSLASSLLTLGMISDPEAPNVYSWGDWGNQVYNDYSYEASQRIRSSMSALRSQVSSGNVSNIQQAFNLCTALKTKSDGELFLSFLAREYLGTAQDDFARSGYPFETLMNATLALPANASYVDVLNLVLKGPPGECVTWYAPFDIRSSYQYLQCTYFPQLNTFTAQNSIWGLNSPSLFLNSSHESLLDPWCEAAFGFPSVKGGSAYQASLGLDTDTLKNTSRLILSGGLTDPITATGTPPWYPGQHTLEDSIVRLIQGGAHGSDVLAASPDDSQGLVEARAAHVNMFKAWLSAADE